MSEAATSPRFWGLYVTLALLLCRPTVFAERAPFLGPGLLIVFACVAWPNAARASGRVPWMPLGLFTLAWLWLYAHPLFAPGSEPNFWTSTATVFVPVVIFGLVVCSDTALLDRVRRYLVAVVVATSGLGVAAFVLGAVVGYGALVLGVLPVGYSYAGGSAILFPGALNYGPDFGAELPRLLGLGREPGMGAIFIGWAFFALPPDWPRRRLWQAVLLLALACTQSTTGLGVFAAAWAFRAVVGRDVRLGFRLASLVLAGFGAYVAVFNPTFGLLAKVSAENVSYTYRQTAMERGLEAFSAHFWDATSDLPLSSVNMIAGISVNAAPWFLLMTAFLLTPVFRRDWRGQSALVVLLSVMVSQPLAGSTALIVLTLVSYSASLGKDDPLPGRGPAEHAGHRGVVRREGRDRAAL